MFRSYTSPSIRALEDALTFAQKNNTTDPSNAGGSPYSVNYAQFPSPCGMGSPQSSSNYGNSYATSSGSSGGQSRPTSSWVNAFNG
jgi:hypothetical protein